MILAGSARVGGRGHLNEKGRSSKFGKGGTGHLEERRRETEVTPKERRERE
jgi:hypothetical protein